MVTVFALFHVTIYTVLLFITSNFYHMIYSQVLSTAVEIRRLREASLPAGHCRGRQLWTGCSMLLQRPGSCPSPSRLPHAETGPQAGGAPCAPCSRASFWSASKMPACHPSLQSPSQCLQISGRLLSLLVILDLCCAGLSDDGLSRLLADDKPSGRLKH